MEQEFLYAHLYYMLDSVKINTLFLNTILVNHPDILFAVENHMVCHADPQMLIKLCDRSIQFFQGADEVVDNMLVWY